MNRYNTASVILFLILGTGIVNGSGSRSSVEPGIQSPERPPNFVVIFTDDQGYGDLSCFGSPLVSTPEIDQLAEEGAKLTSFYVAAPVCTPSRAALMTGCYPKRISMATGSSFIVLFPNDPKGLNPHEVTIAEVLKTRGYATGIFGKWHLGDQPEFLPTRQGFDEFFGIPYSHDIHPYHPNEDWDFPPLPLLDGERVIETDPDADYLTSRITGRAVKFIEEHRDEPFFLYVPHPIPHVPLHISPDFMESVPDTIREVLALEGNSVDYRTRNQLYAQAISEIDWSVGEIMDALKKQGLDKNTLVIFTSDNGPGSPLASAGPLRGRKGSTWEGGMREPAVAWWPGKIQAGIEIGEMMTAMDLLPTFAGLAGAEVPQDRVIDGKDIWPLLSGKPGTKTPHDRFFYHHPNQLRAVRSGPWKYHRIFTNQEKGSDENEDAGEYRGALYNLEEDLGETTDVSAENPEIAARLQGYLEEFEEELGKGDSISTNCRPAGWLEPHTETFELIRSAREMRELLWQDPHRPRYHLMPPEGYFNDANGALFWNGRYHMFYLARTPIPDPKDPEKEIWVATWDHASSRDLVHWIYHPPVVRPAMDGSAPLGIYSGGAIKNAPRPTLIYHVPGQGTCISVAEDDDLIRWKALPQNPVIPMHKEGDEYIVFDPCGWYEDSTYYALIGNKNRRPGYEGDCSSLFTSTDLVHWEYKGPFYQSKREWTDEVEDAACPDFYPLGNKHMLLMHGHRPYGQCHYYLGDYKNERFYPLQHGRMNWPGGKIMAPEALLDDKGRSIFFGWIDESRTGVESFWGYGKAIVPGLNDRYGWASVMSLPRIMSLNPDGTLGIRPAPELKALRLNPRRQEDIKLPVDREVTLEGISGECLELYVEFDPQNATEIGIKVRCSPENAEETLISFVPADEILKIDFERSTLGQNVAYEGGVTAQEAPFYLNKGEPLKLRIFLDRSVLEVFANGRQCITQRIYPSRSNSQAIRLFSKGGSSKVTLLEAWDMEQVAVW
jgi:arylsulfatase A